MAQSATGVTPGLRLDELDRMYGKLDREERALERALAETSQRIERVRLRTLARGRAYVRFRRAGLLPAGEGLDALVDHATQLERLRRALARDMQQARKLLATKVELGRRLEEVRSRKGPLRVQLETARQLQDTIHSANDRALAFERAFSGGGSAGHTAIYGANVGPGEPTEPQLGFGALRGRLPFPIPGRSEVRIAHRGGGATVGLEMSVAVGAPVRAVYPGRVVFADEYADYGKAVIVDHGDGYFTVSANLGEIDVTASDEVQAGTRLGTVGGGSAGNGAARAHLYFELRRGEGTLDPAEWFGI